MKTKRDTYFFEIKLPCCEFCRIQCLKNLTEICSFDSFNIINEEECIMASIVFTLLSFIVALIISTVIIYVIAKLLGETEGITTAFFAALIGTVVYTIIYYVLPNNLLIAAIIAGIVWLLALQKLYTVGWLKSLLIAVVVWIVTTIVGWFLPTLTGPM